MAIGLSGEPVPPLMGSGAAVSRNSHRLRAAVIQGPNRNTAVPLPPIPAKHGPHSNE